MKGTYCLVMKLKNNETINIGRRKQFFNSGYYIYVGSALNNLEKRIERHRTQEKKKHWHIDYFLGHARILDVKTIVSSERLECVLNNKMKQLSDSEPMKGFGSSDCKCSTHLYYFENNPIMNEEFMKLFVQG